MPSGKYISRELKKQIVERIKNGITVKQAALDHGVSERAIYDWLSDEGLGQKNPNLVINRLVREKRELVEIIGHMSLELSKLKKNKYGSG